MKDNKLIAEFMGFQQTTLGWYDAEETLINVESDNTFDTLKYDTDWNWLMPVIKKILDISLELDSMKMLYYEITDSIPVMEHTYQAVIDFIKWYDESNDKL